MSGPVISDALVRQIHAIRDGGRYNMMDRKGVQVEADALEYYELVVFLEEHPEAYFHYILTGHRG